MGTGTLNLNILKTEAQTDPIIELTDSGANGGVIFSGVTTFNDSATFTSTTTFNDSATFNSIVNFSGSSSLSLQDSSIPVSKLQVPGGTPSSSTFLRGDNQWAAPPAVNTSAVLSATAGASFGAVGTYAYLMNATSSTLSDGSTRAGSGLRYNESVAGGTVSRETVNTYNGGGTAPSGTWRKMGGGVIWKSAVIGEGTHYFWYSALYLRIS